MMSAAVSLAGVVLVAATTMSGAAAADTWPVRPVRLVTGSVGTFSDGVARHLANALAARWAQPVVVENVSGPGQIVPTGMVARTPVRDGHVLLLADRTALAAAPNLYRTLNYDVSRDLAPVSLVATSPLWLVAHPTLPANDLREFLAYARAHAGPLPIASAGPATAPHMANEALRLATGIDVLNVHYKGGGAAITAVLSGEVKVGFLATPALPAMVNTGRLKAFAVTSRTRSSAAPDVPSAHEAGLPGFESVYWIGFLAPRGVPAATAGRIHRDLVAVLAGPEMRGAIAAQGGEASPGTPEAFAEYIQLETARLKAIIEATGMRAD